MPEIHFGVSDKGNPITKARCHKCNIVYYWRRSAHHLLKDTMCPKCGHYLHPTAHYIKSAPVVRLEFGIRNKVTCVPERMIGK